LFISLSIKTLVLKDKIYKPSPAGQIGILNSFFNAALLSRRFSSLQSEAILKFRVASLLFTGQSHTDFMVY
jgi:hypothetical protein